MGKVKISTKYGCNNLRLKPMVMDFSRLGMGILVYHFVLHQNCGHLVI